MHGIPSNGGKESFSEAARVRTRCGVIKALGLESVEEPKRALAFLNKEVINQQDYTHHCLDNGGA